MRGRARASKSARWRSSKAAKPGLKPPPPRPRGGGGACYLCSPPLFACAAVPLALGAPPALIRRLPFGVASLGRAFGDSALFLRNVLVLVDSVSVLGVPVLGVPVLVDSVLVFGSVLGFVDNVSVLGRVPVFDTVFAVPGVPVPAGPVAGPVPVFDKVFAPPGAPVPVAAPPPVPVTPLAPTTPVPVNWPACEVAATPGLPLLTEWNSALLVLAVCCCSVCAAVGATCCSLAKAAWSAVGLTVVPPAPPL